MIAYRNFVLCAGPPPNHREERRCQSHTAGARTIEPEKSRRRPVIQQKVRGVPISRSLRPRSPEPCPHENGEREPVIRCRGELTPASNYESLIQPRERELEKRPLRLGGIKATHKPRLAARGIAAVHGALLSRLVQRDDGPRRCGLGGFHVSRINGKPSLSDERLRPRPKGAF